MISYTPRQCSVHQHQHEISTKEGEEMTGRCPLNQAQMSRDINLQEDDDHKHRAQFHGENTLLQRNNPIRALAQCFDVIRYTVDVFPSFDTTCDYHDSCAVVRVSVVSSKWIVS